MIKIGSHLISLMLSMSSKRVSGHFSSSFKELFRLPSQDLKLSTAHFVEFFFVFFGTKGFANSFFVKAENLCFLVGGWGKAVELRRGVEWLI